VSEQTAIISSSKYLVIAFCVLYAVGNEFYVLRRSMSGIADLCPYRLILWKL